MNEAKIRVNFLRIPKYMEGQIYREHIDELSSNILQHFEK